MARRQSASDQTPGSKVWPSLLRRRISFCLLGRHRMGQVLFASSRQVSPSQASPARGIATNSCCVLALLPVRRMHRGKCLQNPTNPTNPYQSLPIPTNSYPSGPVPCSPVSRLIPSPSVALPARLATRSLWLAARRLVAATRQDTQCL